MCEDSSGQNGFSASTAYDEDKAIRDPFDGATRVVTVRVNA